jgi:Tol biopolymer transport system component
LALSLTAGGVYWFKERQPSAPREIKFRQLTFNSAENAVKRGAAISPDGKYLAYVDGKGIQIRLLETGETHIVPEPKALKDLKPEWEFPWSAWLSDSTRFLVNAHPAGESPEVFSSEGASIWMVSILGGEPRKLRDNAWASAISPDGSTIAFSTKKGTFGDREIWLMGIDGENARKLYESDETGAMGGLMWLPRGQRVVYGVTDKSGDSLVTRELKGPVTTILPPPDMKKIGEVAILPDGRLLYTLPEPDAVGNSCNYWTQHLDERTGTLDHKPVRLTNWGAGCAGATSVTADGKKLIFNKWMAHVSIYVADVAPNGTRISGTRRFTLTESWDWPADWTTDSKEVIFTSNRNGHRGIFKQSLNEDTAEPLVLRSEDVNFARVTPDGRWVIYLVSTKANDREAAVQVMRVPTSGGPSEIVLTARSPGITQCARPPANLCVLLEDDLDRKQYTVSSFDALSGRGRELARIDYGANKGDYDLVLSPDGTRFAFTTGHEALIHILSLRGQPLQEIRVKGGWNRFEDMEWAADSKGLFVAHSIPGGAALLYVDFQGNAHVLWQQHGGTGTYGFASPDGRHLAFFGWTIEGNVWMMENF